MEKQDFFRVLIEKGILKISGLDKNLKSYRIIEYKGKEFKLSLEEITRYKVIYYIGKPFEVFYNTDEELKEGLKSFYLKHKDKDYFFDVNVFNSLDENITESQFIEEMVGEFLDE
jgi:hypothetical protein